MNLPKLLPLSLANPCKESFAESDHLFSMKLTLLTATISPFESGDLFLILAIGFGIAALIWLFLWLLQWREGESEAELVGETAGSGDAGVPVVSETAAAAAVAAAPEKKESLDLISGSGPKTGEVDRSDMPLAEGVSASDIPDDFDTATADEAANFFAAEIASGEAKQDDVYGIVYNSAPTEVDDLKQIKGIANVLEGKLHTIGVYRFKQVAVWTDDACKEFSKMLTFKNRIYRDNWIAQAKDFHEKKYGERIDF